MVLATVLVSSKLVSTEYTYSMSYSFPFNKKFLDQFCVSPSSIINRTYQQITFKMHTENFLVEKVSMEAWDEAVPKLIYELNLVNKSMSPKILHT